MRCVVIFLGAVALASAGTFYQRPAAPVTTSQITSLSDKDAIQKSKMHPAFQNAGKRDGIEIWRIENFEPVPVPSNTYGTFYKGDSYIVLKTKVDKRNNFSWDIHFWLGAATSQDEAGAAAILSVGLDDKFGGAAVQHREVQGHESSQFLGYFQPAIRYLDGGHSSGFSHVITNAGADKRLFQIKGKRNIRVRQVDPLISSMNKGDCFILDVGSDIYVYVGEKAKRTEKLKAISVANQIRDVDHNGRGKVDIIDEYSSEADTARFFTALGSGNRALVPEESSGGDDQTFERGEEQTVTLYEISDASGKLKVTPVPRPYVQQQLKPEECYILDTVSGSIYVWVGKRATDKEKSESMSKAQEFLTAKNYPSWVHVTRIPQGTEPTAFKQYFSTWKDVGMSHSRLVRSASEEALHSEDPTEALAAARSIAKAGAARAFMSETTNGFYKIFKVQGLGMEDLYDSEHLPGKFTEFYSNKAYVIRFDYKYQENSAEKTGHIIYYWVGRNCSKQELAAAIGGAEMQDHDVGYSATVVHVPQGEEPKHFLQIFKGRFIVHGADKKFENDTVEGARLYQVFGNETQGTTRAVQVPATASSINSDDVFLLYNPLEGKSFVYFGEYSNHNERTMGVEFADHLLGSKGYEILDRIFPPEPFWTLVGGDSEPKNREIYWYMWKKLTDTDPRLYDVTINSGNKVTFEEVDDISQSELDIDGMNLLDAVDVIYVWTGAEAPSNMKKAAHYVCEKYKNGPYRYLPNTERVLIAVKQGLEPAAFKRLFPSWDDALFEKRKHHNDKLLASFIKNDV